MRKVYRTSETTSSATKFALYGSQKDKRERKVSKIYLMKLWLKTSQT